MFRNNNNNSNNGNVGSSSSPPPGQRRTSNAAATPHSTSGSTTTGTFGAILGSIRPPQQQLPAYSRHDHLESYLFDESLKRSTRKVSPDDSTYDTVFVSTLGDTLILRVHWPALTAQTQVPPAMSLAGVIAKHPWLDSGMRVIGYEPIQTLQSWNASRILLGAAVHEVVQHLQLNPPEVIEITDAGLRGIQKAKITDQFNRPSSNISPVRSIDQVTTARSGTSTTIHKTVYSNDAPPPRYENLLSPSVPEIEMPPIPKRFEQLDSLSREELDRLLEDEIELTLFCNKLPIVQTYQKILTSVIDDNVVQARKNLTKEKELQELHEEVVQLQEQLKEGVERFKELEKIQNEYCEPPDMKVVMRELTKAKKAALEESDAIAEAWLKDGETDVDQFLSKFLETRKLHHLYAAKLELLMKGSS